MTDAIRVTIYLNEDDSDFDQRSQASHLLSEVMYRLNPYEDDLKSLSDLDNQGLSSPEGDLLVQIEVR